MYQNKFILVVLILLITQVYAFSQTIIPLYIPSSVTSDLSRMFYKKVKAFENLNPEIKVEFHSKDSYSGVLDEVLKNSVNKKSSGVIIAELSELPTLVDSHTIIALDDFMHSEQELKDEGLLRRNNRNWKSTINMFNYQAYPVTYYSTAGMGFLKDNAKFNWTTDLMPKNRVYGTLVGASTVFISNYMTKDEEKLAWKLLKYLLSDEVQIDMSLQSGYLAVTKSAYKNKRMVLRYSTPPFKKIKEQLKFAKSKIMTKNYSKIREILKQAINRSLDDGMDPEKSLNIAQHEAQKFLK